MFLIERDLQRFCKEVITWKALRHPNLLPLVGVIMTANTFAMVSGWMANGNINEFVTAHRAANRFELVSSPFNLPALSCIIDPHTISAVGGCCKGLDSHA